VRRWLFAGLALTLLCCGAVAAAVTAVFGASAVSTVDKVDFERPLTIPPLAPSRLDERGRRVFDLRAQAGTTDFGFGATRTWGFNGTYLGPTLRASRGEQVVVNIHNGLPEPTTVHWHGMHLPARMDGGPHQAVRAGATWSPAWRVAQPAATLWYHPHPHEATERHVYRGLAGLFLVDDPGTDVAALPRRYGVDDVPIIVQDKSFDDGQFDTSHRFGSDIGILGDTLLVNGTAGPYHQVSTERVRLRLLNASTARVYNFGFSDNRQFALVGTDGGLLARPYQMQNVQLSPGERAEIVVTMRPGERVVLRSHPPDLRKNSLDKRFAGGSDEFDVLQLRASASLAPNPPVPATLVSTPRLDPRDAVKHREFTFSGRHINGERMEMDRVDAVVTKDTTEVWTVRNGHGTPHSFHIHDVQFQVLDVDGDVPPPMLSGWKDTIFLRPHTGYRVIARFADYADPTTPYMFHCHVLLHEDGGMMSQFLVVEPGQRPALGAHHHD
jgi:FtsP/CotA-like multicopper oxidase with cupredoxin domain